MSFKKNVSCRFQVRVFLGLFLLSAITVLSCSERAIAGLGEDVRAMELAHSNGAGSKSYIREQAPKRSEVWKAAAEAGNPAGLVLMARCLELGAEVDKDLSLACEYYKRAAEQGYAPAQCNLGFNYEEGEIVPKSDALAVEWYRKAAEQGYARAQFNLGVMYAQGRGGLQQRDEEAVRLYRLAADQGFAMAQFNLGVCYGQGLGGLKQTDEEHLRLCRLAAEQGMALAQVDLGIMYLQGFAGLTPDQDIAVELWHMAAAQGNAKGLLFLGKAYANGWGNLETSIRKAITYYRKAAQLELPEAMHFYGLRLLSGNGVERNTPLGCDFIHRAASAGDPEALETTTEAFFKAKCSGITISLPPNRTYQEFFGDMLGVEEYHGVGNAPVNSPQWVQEQLEYDPFLGSMFGIENEDQ